MINKLLSAKQICAIFICVFSCCNGNHGVVNNDISKNMIGTWRILNLKVHSVKGTNTIEIDTFFNSSTFNEITVIDKDSIHFYVADSISTSLSSDSLEYRTVFSHHAYSLIVDSIAIFWEFGVIKARVDYIQDTMTLYFAIDSQSPYSQQYGLGTMERKYARYSGSVPPLSWPPLY